MPLIMTMKKRPTKRRLDKNFTGFTFVKAKKDFVYEIACEENSFLLRHYVDGKKKDEFILDPTEDSIESEIAALYPIPELPQCESEDDIDYDVELPIDYCDIPIICKEKHYEILKENLADYPYEEECEDAFDSDFDYSAAHERLVEEAKEEEDSFERWERSENAACSNID